MDPETDKGSLVVYAHLKYDDKTAGEAIYADDYNVNSIIGRAVEDVQMSVIIDMYMDIHNVVFNHVNSDITSNIRTILHPLVKGGINTKP